MIFDPILLPFSEVHRQFHIIFFTHGVFFNSFETLYLFEDGVGVVVNDIDNHASLCSVRAECSHILGKLSNKIAFVIFELQLGIGWNRTIPAFDILFG